MAEPSSLVHVQEFRFRVLALALLGLVYLGIGYNLRATNHANFSEATENLGLLAFQAMAYPLTLGIWRGEAGQQSGTAAWVIAALGVAALGLIIAGLPKMTGLSRPWRSAWGLALAGAAALLAACALQAQPAGWQGPDEGNGIQWITTLALFVFCLLQTHVGIQERSAFHVNLGVAFIALHIISTYCRLVYTMGATGLMFVLSGLFLIFFGVFLERKRRALLRGIQSPAA